MKKRAPKKEIKREWHLFDAEGKVLGRLASEIALVLRGKNKLGFVPYLDLGDWVVVVNTKKIRVTGKKRESKIYYHYTGYPGGIRAETLGEMLQENPAKVLERAVRGMLPDNKLRKLMLKRLKVFAGSEHPYKDKFQIPNSKSQTNSKSQ